MGLLGCWVLALWPQNTISSRYFHHSKESKKCLRRAVVFEIANSNYNTTDIIQGESIETAVDSRLSTSHYYL